MKMDETNSTVIKVNEREERINTVVNLLAESVSRV